MILTCMDRQKEPELSPKWESLNMEEQGIYAMRMLISNGCTPSDHIITALRRPNVPIFLTIEEIQSFKKNLLGALENVRQRYDLTSVRYCAILAHRLLHQLLSSQIQHARTRLNTENRIRALDELRGEDEKGIARTKHILRQHTAQLLTPAVTIPVSPLSDAVDEFDAVDQMHGGDPADRETFVHELSKLTTDS